MSKTVVLVICYPYRGKRLERADEKEDTVNVYCLFFVVISAEEEAGNPEQVVRMLKDKETYEQLTERIREAAAETAATHVEAMILGAWPDGDKFAEIVNSLRTAPENLHEEVMNSLANLAGTIGAPGPVSLVGADVTATLVLAPIADPIDGAARDLELAGLIFALLTGLHPLAIISAKLLARDAIDNAITSTFVALLKAVDETVGDLGPDNAADHLTAARLQRAAETTAGA